MAVREDEVRTVAAAARVCGVVVPLTLVAVAGVHGRPAGQLDVGRRLPGQPAQPVQQLLGLRDDLRDRRPSR